MPNQPRMQQTEEQLKTILSMRENGVPKTRIAEKIGVCPLVVTRWLDEYDGLIRPQHYPKYGKKAAHGGRNRLF